MHLINVMYGNVCQPLFAINVFLQKKCKFQCDFDDNLSVTPVFIKQIFEAVEQRPPPLLPPHGCGGGGVVVAFYICNAM
jgi:hypothetical protein